MRCSMDGAISKCAATWAMTRLRDESGEAPPPLVAELLGYSYNTTQRHAEIAAQPWARYVTKTAAESN